MTLTPPQIGDLADRSQAQRRLEKNPWHAPDGDGGNVAMLLIL